jgi:hypothetical protein
MFVLANNPKKDDILQLALLQPEDSEVYTQALIITKDKKKKSWFKWRCVKGVPVFISNLLCEFSSVQGGKGRGRKGGRYGGGRKGGGEWWKGGGRRLEGRRG